jgi:hypothetical protein
VDTQLEQLGVTSGGRLQPPVNPQRAGWFPGSSVPGELGPAVLAGHRDSLVGPAVLLASHDLRLGDTVIVTRSDGGHSPVRDCADPPGGARELPTEQVYGATPDRMLRLNHLRRVSMTMSTSLSRQRARGRPRRLTSVVRP